ncbi:hypothetical protein HNQ69_000517 [Bartonella callosciuri]|uniref:Uncharacterized protein n=1 Tax=Bartonella callosciuri TaxID=686223 RepID=A0A840NL84_9HYPH|nr:hypothetical protein [Bartonella callosciuri]
MPERFKYIVASIYSDGNLNYFLLLFGSFTAIPFWISYHEEIVRILKIFFSYGGVGWSKKYVFWVLALFLCVVFVLALLMFILI